MVQLPSDVQNKKDWKLTRRRLMKTLAASGFAVGSVANVSVDDVKAAASDQVVISLDFAGNEKRYVPSDWYDRVVHTRRTHRKMKNKWMGHSDILGVFYHPGHVGGENPKIEVILNHKSKSKDETRGKVPEEKDGVEVKVKEGNNPEKHQCSNYDFSEELNTHVPGSAMVHVWKQNDFT